MLQKIFTFSKPSVEDLFSGFFVFLVALPLCMGIAMASGFPAVSGIFTAIIGGCIASFIGSAPLTIKGPAAGLIAIVIGAVQELGVGDMALGYKRTLAVGVIAALIQIFFAIMRVGSLAALMPIPVVHGMLAAIGVIIVSKQIHLLFGVTPVAKTPFGLLAEIGNSATKINPEVFTIGLIAFLLLIILPRINWSWLKKIPIPLIVVAVTVPLSLFFDFNHAHQYHIFGKIYSVGPQFLVTLPEHMLGAITLPDFSAIFSFPSMKYIAMLSLVGSIESLLTVTAAEAIKPSEKPADLNKDLFSTGIANFISAMIGGLPMISEIVRTKVNIDNGAKSSWSNVFHGIFLWIFAAFLPHLLHLIPLTVLAAMLVFTGFRLASPQEFLKMLRAGKESFLLFIATLVMTLATDLLLGVIFGLVLKLFLQKSREVYYARKAISR